MNCLRARRMRAFFILILSIAPALLSTDTNAAPMPLDSQGLTSLQQFTQLAHQCAASLKLSSNAHDIELFKAICAHEKKISSRIKKQYRDHDNLPPDLEADITAETEELLAQYLPELPQLEQSSTLNRQIRSIYGTTQNSDTHIPDRLGDLISYFKQQHGDILAQKTTWNETLTRVFWRSIFDTLYEYGRLKAKKRLRDRVAQRAEAAGKETEEKPLVPTLSGWMGEKLSHMTPTGITDRAGYFKLIPFHVTAHLALDELLPNQIRTTEQRVVELLAPAAIGLTCATFLYKGSVALSLKDWSKLVRTIITKSFLRIMLVRLYLDKKHPAYEAVNMAAIALPFVIGTLATLAWNILKGGKKAAESKTLLNQVNTWGVAACEGAESMLVYELIPFLVKRAIKQSQSETLNPEQRKKALSHLARNITRDLFA